MFEILKKHTKKKDQPSVFGVTLCIRCPNSGTSGLYSQVEIPALLLRLYTYLTCLIHDLLRYYMEHVPVCTRGLGRRHMLAFRIHALY